VARPAPNPIYAAFIQHPLCVLTPEDREHLHTVRGFSDEAIDSSAFRSCRPENAAVVEALQSQFSREALLDAGLLRASGTVIEVNPQILQPRILIPYHGDQAGTFYALRPHKLGFKGLPVNFYCCGNQTGEVILAESEFKAVAAFYGFGYTAIGIPGISSFAREHFNKLTTHLMDVGVERLVVMFDNEIKDDPSLPNYKSDPEKRWDTQYYSMLMAKRIAENCHMDTAIATLPDAWRVNGKVDIDGALAAGHTQEEFLACMENAMRPGDHLDGLQPEARRVVVRKLRAFDLSMKIRRSAAGYQVARPKKGGGDPDWSTITNFTFDILAKYQTQDQGIVRLVKIRQEGKESEPFRISAGDMVKPDWLQKACYREGTGDAWFKGSADDLIDIFDLEHTRGPEALIVEPNHIGKIVGKDMWLFGSGAIMGDRIVLPDEKGVCWNGSYGYSPPMPDEEKQQDSVHRNNSKLPYPSLSLNANSDPNLKEICKRIHDNFGGADDKGFHSVICMAWALACVYSNDFYDMFGSFPILYFCGPKEAGKSTLARWLLKMFGLYHAGINASGTIPGIQRTMSYYSSLPVFIDECRAETIEGLRESMFRSVYDRQSLVKAAGATGNETVTIPVRSPLMLAGEAVPGDAALNSRCLMPEFSKDRKGFGSEYEWLEENSKSVFPTVLPYLVLRGPAAKNLMDEADDYRKELQVNSKLDPRVARNYAVILASYMVMIDPTDELQVGHKILELAKSQTEENREDSILAHFFEDLPKLRNDGEIKINNDYNVSGVHLNLNLRRCWEAWQKHRRNLPGLMTPNTGTALKLLRQTKYLVKSNHPVKIGGVVNKCTVLELDPLKGCPQVLIDFSSVVG